MSHPSLGLIVLRAADLQRSLEFYGALGLEFTEEQHGTGPVHYSAQIGGTVLEIFPGKPGSAPDRRDAGATLLGFQLANLDDVITTLANLSVTVLTAPQDSPWGRRAVVQDPDGRAVDLTQPLT